MSLLLDALKRAEQEKLARQPGVAGSIAAPRAHAAPAGAAGLELQPMSSASAPAPSAPASASRAEAAAQSAHNVFQAKGEADSEASGNRAMLWFTVAAVAIVAIAAAGYVWYTVKGLTPQYASTPRPRPAPTPPPASSTQVPLAPAAGSPPPPLEATVASPAATVPTVPARAPLPSARVEAAMAPMPPETPAERLARAAAESPMPPPLQMERAPMAAPRVPPEVSSAYEFMRKGEWANARRAYQAAVASDPTSVDAHLGLATVAAREGNRMAAIEQYRRVLDLDPRNGTALAGLAALSDFSRPEALEAQLRADIDRSPTSAALHLTLGNFYSTQGRWSEAQGAYYEAHRLDPGSPEIAHNLAVSLDRLGQARLAAGFYRRALEAARAGSTSVDTAAVARRLAEIE